MNRKHFLFLTTGIIAAKNMMASDTSLAETIYFKDDGVIPNSKNPLLVYRKVFAQRDDAGANWLEQKFSDNNWSNSWRNGIFSYHHYHSITHEVLGIYSGSAMVHMGGEKGKRLRIEAGDILVIPAGVGHKNLESENLGVVGAYPGGMRWDMNYGKPGERPQADENIAKVPLPSQDPLMGAKAGLVVLWT